MKQKHNSVKRIICRSVEELRASKEIAKRTSILDASIVFIAKAIIQVVNRGWIKESLVVNKLLRHKHTIMQQYFDEAFAEFVRGYEFGKTLPETDPEMGRTIWLCWWQGEENAPELTRKCIESIRNCAGEYEVKVINEENYKQYVEFPEWIEKKHREGIISRTHYSDILRLSLLSAYGGLWLDATVYCVASELSKYLECPLWTVKRPGYGYLSVAAGRFVTGSMGCDWEHRWIFAIIRDFVLHYWKENDLLLDYLVFDYLIDMVMRNNERLAGCFEEIEPNNPNSDELLKIMGKPYDEALWNKIRKDTSLYYLTWKRQFPLEVDGVDTFYGRLLKDEL